MTLFKLSLRYQLNLKFTSHSASNFLLPLFLIQKAKQGPILTSTSKVLKPRLFLAFIHLYPFTPKSQKPSYAFYQPNLPVISRPCGYPILEHTTTLPHPLLAPKQLYLLHELEPTPRTTLWPLNLCGFTLLLLDKSRDGAVAPI